MVRSYPAPFLFVEPVKRKWKTNDMSGMNDLNDTSTKRNTLYMVQDNKTHVTCGRHHVTIKIRYMIKNTLFVNHDTIHRHDA